jgi:hypothetical protein
MRPGKVVAYRAAACSRPQLPFKAEAQRAREKTGLLKGTPS